MPRDLLAQQPRDLLAPQQLPRPAVTEAQPPADNRSFLRRTRDFFTGVDRATEQTENLPEFPRGGLLQGSDTSALKAMGLSMASLLTFNPDELADIISSNVPEIEKVENKDNLGNVFPILVNNKTGAVSIVNKPGVSLIDISQLVGTGALFSTGASGGAGGLLGRSLKTGAKIGGIQAGIEGAQTLSGGEFDRSGIAAAAVGGAIGEAIVPLFGGAWRTIRANIAKGQISAGVKRQFVKEAQKLGIPEEEVTDDVIQKWAEQIDQRTGLEREFDVTLTRGQRSGDQDVLSAEDSLRSGTRGGGAQREFLQGERRQLEELNTAAAGVQERIARGSPIVESRGQAGAVIREGVQEAEAVADDAITQAYAEVGDATLSPEGVMGLITATKKSVDSFEFPKEREVAKSYNALVSALNRIEDEFTRLSASGNKILPVHIKQIERLRRTINQYASAAELPTDARNINAMKKAFDEYLDEAVIKGMFDGDTESLAALKEARGITREYFQKFGLNTKTSRLGTGRDPAGQFVTKIILESPTDEQVVKSLWSASGLSKDGAVKLAKRYKSILGPDSDEWNMVRQSAFDQLIAKKTIDGKQFVDGAKSASNLAKAKNTGQELLDEFFSKDELAEISRFIALAKRSVPTPVRSRENPSGTAQKLAKAVRLAEFLPLFDANYAAAAGGGILFRGRKARRAARDAFRPFDKVRQTIRGGQGATAAGIVQQNEEAE